MFTREEFETLEVGHQIETEPLLPGVTDEKVLLIVSKVEPNKRSFSATLFGVTLGAWTCTLKDGALKWEI